jgi:hypothetical protein
MHTESCTSKLEQAFLDEKLRAWHSLRRCSLSVQLYAMQKRVACPPGSRAGCFGVYVLPVEQVTVAYEPDGLLCCRRAIR